MRAAPDTERKFSTVEVAGMLDILQPNLQRLIADKRFPVPPLIRVGKVKIRLWSEADVERAKQMIGKKKNTRRRRRIKRPPRR